jgi:hypothetical protein
MYLEINRTVLNWGDGGKVTDTVDEWGCAEDDSVVVGWTDAVDEGTEEGCAVDDSVVVGWTDDVDEGTEEGCAVDDSVVVGWATDDGVDERGVAGGEEVGTNGTGPESSKQTKTLRPLKWI